MTVRINALNIITSNNPNVPGCLSLTGAIVVRIHPPLPGRTLKSARFIIGAEQFARHLYALSALRDTCKVRLDNAFCGSVSHQAGGVMNVQFVHNLLPVFLNRLDTET